MLPECAWCVGIWLQPRDLHSLVTVNSFDTYITFIWFNLLKIYVLIFILYITLFLKSLFTCKNSVILQLKLHCILAVSVFWTYWQSSYVTLRYVTLGLDLYCNALRHISFQHKEQNSHGLNPRSSNKRIRK